MMIEEYRLKGLLDLHRTYVKHGGGKCRAECFCHLIQSLLEIEKSKSSFTVGVVNLNLGSPTNGQDENMGDL